MASKKADHAKRLSPVDSTAASEGESGIGKVLTLEQLAPVCEALRKRGRKIVLCHGVFDLMHVGHVRHLKAAKKFGDTLVVSITADRHVNKGPDRPAFPAELRSEFLAGLELVDFVTIVNDPSAAPSIQAVKPTFYVKGGEYADPQGDITGKIVAERELVESAGGELVFTHDITFSSSNLLNKHFAFTDEPTRAYLDRHRSTGLEKRIASYLRQIEKMRILIIGETIIDRYVYVSPMGKAAKENIIATLYREEETFAGGVVAAANHLAAMCPNVELISILGDSNVGENYENLVRSQIHSSVATSFIRRTNGPTVQKTRFVEPTYVRKLFEVYHMDDRPLSKGVQDSFHDLLREKIKAVDLVIVCDFGHGLISQETVDLLDGKAPFLAVNTQSNAGNIGYNLVNKYRHADFVCIDAMEAWLAIRDKHADLHQVAALRLREQINCPNIIITHGKAGCYASDGNSGAVHIPSFGGTAVDTVGAGDAFFVMAAPMMAAGADCETAGFLGNVAGAIAIGIVGHRRYLTKLEIERYVMTLLK